MKSSMLKTILIAVTIAIALTANAYGSPITGCFNMIWYDGANGISIGTPADPGTTGWYLGSEYSAEAYIGVLGSLESSLSPITASLTAFDLTGPTRSGVLVTGGGGQLYAATVTATGLPNGNASIQIRAWYNGGQYATYEAAMSAGKNIGKSSIMTINLKSNTDPTAQSLTDIGMSAFTVSAPQSVPEPSSIMLMSLSGAVVSLALFRRRKQ